MSRAIGVVTVARSDYGHLTPLLQALHAAPDVELLVYIAGSHLAARFGRTASLVEADGWEVVARVDMDIDDDAPGAIAAATGRGVTGFAREFARRAPDILVVLGDRYEMLSAAVAALPFALPVAHLHGGEVTEGAIDEQIRHAITKLAHLHFPAAEPYAERVRQLGEEAWRVHCCGAPGLDRLQAQATMSPRGAGRAAGAGARPSHAAGDVPPGDAGRRRRPASGRGAGRRPREGARRPASSPRPAPTPRIER